MFCPQCGTELPDDAQFCTDCGAQIESEAAEQSPPPEGDDEPILTVRPVFIPWLTLAKVVPIQLFGTAWGAGFLGGVTMFGLEAVGLDLPTAAPFVFWGALAFFGIPLVAYLLKNIPTSSRNILSTGIGWNTPRASWRPRISGCATTILLKPA